MSKSNTFETNWLNHVFLNQAITLIGDAAGLLGSAAPGDLFISLHTADPGEAGDQTTNEAAYTGYARKAVPRTAGGWVVTGNLAENVAAVLFDICTAGSANITHFGIGTSLSGVGKLLYSGTTSPLAVSANITPEFPAGAIDATED